ncbi:MAG TPA: chromate transporter [Candidatus Cloacimonadota bacterium]|nr:chromate transporter [Candidatus Cloacimonadota bacterium]HPT72052.1 chromate transporter [Candidatus Cloacimonadota bacterium]
MASRLKLSFSLFFSFLEIGAFTIGGGYAMLPLIQKEVIEKRKWMKTEDFLDGLALSQSLPGPIAVNIAAYTGYRIAGLIGSIAGVLGAVIPSFIAILLISMFLYQFHQQPLWNRIFIGIRPAVVALIAASLINIGQMSKLKWKVAWLPIIVFILIVFFNISPAWMVILALITGMIFMRNEQ